MQGAGKKSQNIERIPFIMHIQVNRLSSSIIYWWNWTVIMLLRRSFIVQSLFVWNLGSREVKLVSYISFMGNFSYFDIICCSVERLSIPSLSDYFFYCWTSKCPLLQTPDNDFSVLVIYGQSFLNNLSVSHTEAIFSHICLNIRSSIKDVWIELGGSAKDLHGN